MKKLTLILLLTSSVLFSQEAIVTKLGDFTGIKVFSGLQVELIKAEEAKVVITGSKASQVSLKNKNGILKFSIRYTDRLKKGDVVIKVYYLNKIDVLDANEGSSIFSNEVINQQHLELKSQEGARINVVINVKYLTIKSVSGGFIEVVGTTQNQIIDANTGGFYKAFDLESKQATATASAGGNIDVNVSEILNATVNFGGSIYYKGTPEELKTKKVVGGTIKQSN